MKPDYRTFKMPHQGIVAFQRKNATNPRHIDCWDQMGAEQLASACNDDTQKLQHIEIRSRSHYDVTRNISVTSHILTFSHSPNLHLEEFKRTA
jgi:hypothetical protein